MLTTRTKTFGISALVALLATLCAVGVILYSIVVSERSLDEQVRQRAERRVAAEELVSLTALMEATKEKRAQLTEYMLTEDGVVDFLATLEAAARQQSVAIETRSLAVAPLPNNDTFEQLTLEVVVSGTYESVRDMLARFEALPYQIEMRSVLIERLSGEQGEILWRGTYELSVTKYK